MSTSLHTYPSTSSSAFLSPDTDSDRYYPHAYPRSSFLTESPPPSHRPVAVEPSYSAMFAALDEEDDEAWVHAARERLEALVRPSSSPLSRTAQGGSVSFSETEDEPFMVRGALTSPDLSHGIIKDNDDEDSFDFVYSVPSIPSTLTLTLTSTRPLTDTEVTTLNDLGTRLLLYSSSSDSASGSRLSRAFAAWRDSAGLLSLAAGLSAGEIRAHLWLEEGFEAQRI